MEQYFIAGFLGINTWTDFRRRKISLCSIGVFGLIGIIYEGFYRAEPGNMVSGLLPGVCLLLISRLTREALGMGDALVMLVLGLYLGFWGTLEVLFLAMFLAALWAGILLVVKKKGRKYEFPFVPFLLLGYLGRWLL